MIDSLTALQAILEDATAEADCVVERVTVTAGRPPAPSAVGQECQTRIYVFLSEVTDFNQTDQDACEVRSRLAMQYEIWTCYPEDWDDQTDTDESLAAAQCLYELMDLAWCALVAVKDSGDTFGKCEWVELVPLEVQPRQGGAVSALGGLTIPHDCTPSSL